MTSLVFSPLIGFIALVVNGKRGADEPADRFELTSSSRLTGILLILVVVGVFWIALQLLADRF